MHTRAPSASRTAPKPAAARSDAAVAPIPSALAAARSTSPAQWHGSHENDLIGVQHFTPNQPFSYGSHMYDRSLHCAERTMLNAYCRHHTGPLHE